MNQIQSLYQPSFNQHQPLYSGSPSPLLQQQHHLQSQNDFVPPSPVAPFTPASYSHSHAHHSALPPQSLSNDFDGGATAANASSQRQTQAPFGIASSRGQSNPYIGAGSSQPLLSPASPQKYPMAAPPLPASVQRQQSPQSNSNASTSLPSSPSTAANAARERERVALLLDINVELLQEMSRLQGEGKGGATSPQQAALLKSQGLSDKPAADEYIQVFMRLQSNLAYLYSQPDMQALNPQNQNQPINKKGPPHPPHFMRPPPTVTSLEDKYAALRKLFPDWPGRDAPGVQSGGSGHS